MAEDDRAPERVDRRTEGAVFALALLLGLYPPALSYAARGVEAAFSFFAADAFYYLAVADHSVGVPGFTYDGSLPTNGFHPLWQYLLWAVFSTFGLTGASQVVFTFAASVLTSSLGAALFATALLRLTSRPFLALLGAVPGVFYALCLPFHAHCGASWSFANGMESGLSMLVFGVLARSLFAHGPPARGDVRRTLLVSFLVTLGTLARLDDVFLLVPFVGWILLRGGTRREQLRAAVSFLVLPVLLIGAYLAYNVSYSGMLLPTSGAAKGGLALGNLGRLLTPFWPVWLFGSDYGAWRHEMWRVLQLGVPLVACGIHVARVTRSREPSASPRSLPPAELALFLLASFVVLKGAYNLLFVRLWHQGHWYFPVSIMTFNALAVHLVERRCGPRGSGRRALLLATLGALVLGNALVFAKRTEGHNQKYFGLWSRREAITAALRARGLTQGLLDFDDGILAYSLPSPALSGLGFALDWEAQRARAAGQLFSLAYDRGYRLLASLNYPAVARDVPPGPVDLSTSRSEYLRDQDLSAFRFEVAYRDAETGIAFIRFARKAPGE
jgi:hypothetical protein